MPTLTCYPLGNADCCLVELADGRRLFFDYANVRDPKQPDDKRIDLPAALREKLSKADTFDVVAFSHGDDDHVHGAAEFFPFDHAKQYQGGRPHQDSRPVGAGGDHL